MGVGGLSRDSDLCSTLWEEDICKHPVSCFVSDCLLKLARWRKVSLSSCSDFKYPWTWLSCSINATRRSSKSSVSYLSLVFSSSFSSYKQPSIFVIGYSWFDFSSSCSYKAWILLAHWHLAFSCCSNNYLVKDPFSICACLNFYRNWIHSSFWSSNCCCTRLHSFFCFSS